MNARSRMLPRLTLPGSPNVISLPASQAGPSPSLSPGFPTIILSGPGVVPANLSPRQAKARGLMTSGIYGLRSTGSSSSAALQELLVSRLQARLQTLGSTLYRLTWKPWVTPSERSLSRLRASVLRTSATELTGWPTPTTRDWKDGSEQKNVPLNALLGRVAWLAGWPTPTVTDSLRYPSPDSQTRDITLNHAAHLAARGPARLTVTGLLLTGSPAVMGGGGQLNPAHSRWLMGFPPAWDACAPTATRSTRGKRRSS